jgi:multisubunit Na+/H+ antiporter MnhB subunit
MLSHRVLRDEVSKKEVRRIVENPLDQRAWGVDLTSLVLSMLYTVYMLKLIIYVVVGLLVLSFFGISLQHLIDSPTTQANFHYVGQLLERGWNDIQAQIHGIWHSVV